MALLHCKMQKVQDWRRREQQLNNSQGTKETRKTNSLTYLFFGTVGEGGLGAKRPGVRRLGACRAGRVRIVRRSGVRGTRNEHWRLLKGKGELDQQFKIRMRTNQLGLCR